MKSLLTALIMAVSSLVAAQQPPKDQTPPGQTVAPTTPPPETQRIEAASQPARPATSDTGYMEPAQLKSLLHRIWLAEYRINDLLTEVHPERWKLPEATRNSFNQTLENLRKGLAAQEDWRSQFEKRPESVYLGYETYVAINAVLPRLDAVARSVSQYENGSLGAQYSQAGNQLFDLQQTVQPYLELLLRNQDQVLYATQTNLAACQNELGFAMRGRTQPAKPMKNVPPEFKGRRRTKRAAEPSGKPTVAVPAETRPRKR